MDEANGGGHPRPLAWDARPLPGMAQRLTDDAVLTFVIRGYLVLEPALPAGLNERLCARFRALAENPGDGILDAAPELHEVWGHPTVRGGLVSLLGEDARMNDHRHMHVTFPGAPSQAWHQDGTNVRHHQVRTLLAMYYPHDVPAEMGPTVVMPGTHFRNAPTDRMATYANLRGQAALTVKAGSVALVHYDLWHAGSANRTAEPRYMLKFLFDRVSEPAPRGGSRGGPPWRHDPEASGPVARRRLQGEMACPCSQSDHYKEGVLRFRMWNHLLGKGMVAPAGMANPADREA